MPWLGWVQTDMCMYVGYQILMRQGLDDERELMLCLCIRYCYNIMRISIWLAWFLYLSFTHFMVL